MSKLFRFRLEGLLKLRTFKEHKVKVELGKILQEIEAKKIKIEKLNKNLEEIYSHQETIMKESVKGRMASGFNYLSVGIKGDLMKQKQDLKELEKKYDKKSVEMNKALGDTKVIQDLKDKQRRIYERNTNKKREQEIEELISIRSLNE